MPIDPITGTLIGVGISALGSGGSAAINNSGKKKSQARAQQYNLENWERNNAYNHPSAQMARLREAGLNPAMMYGSGSAQNMSGPIAPVKDTGGPDMQNPLAEFANIQTKAAQTDNLQSQATLNIAKGLSEAEDQKLTKAQTETQEALRDGILQLQGEEIIMAQSNNFQKDLEIAQMPEMQKQELIKIKKQIEYIKATTTGAKQKSALDAESLRLLKLGIAPNSPWWARMGLSVGEKINATPDNKTNQKSLIGPKRENDPVNTIFPIGAK